MIKKKRTIFQSIKKDISKGLKRIFYFVFTKIKYHYITAKACFFKKEKKKFKISLLLPTRERSKKFERLLTSLVETCQDIYRIEMKKKDYIHYALSILLAEKNLKKIKDIK